MCIKLLPFIVLLISHSLLAQHHYVVSSAGDSFEDDEIYYAWTLGQIAIGTYSNDEMIVTEGFHQPDLFYTSIGKYYPASEITSDIFPNPVNEILNVNLEGAVKNDFVVSINDLSGRRMKIYQLHGNKNHINISELIQGAYIIKIYSPEHQIISRKKIIKLK